ncbi:major facilitator superfamily domain-containing protein [Xylariaceae sp. FL1019]|nr:major facilitator superfamily domain-containing protein [Xylariaceae sp. FL1019]
MSRIENESGNAAESAPLLAPPDGIHGVSPRDPNSLQSAENIESQRSSINAGNDGVASKPQVSRTKLLPALAVGIFLVSMDHTLIVAAYGKIGSELHALNNTSWIATSYFLTLAIFQPLYGKLCDIFGRKECLLFAYAVFGLGCLGCGLAQDVVQLSVARAVAGAGGGGMISVVSILGVYCVLDLPQTDHSHWIKKLRRVDFIGGLTLGAAVFVLLFGLDNGSNRGWDKTITIVPLAIAPALFVLFVVVEGKVAKEPFAPRHVIFDPPLLAAYGAAFFGVAVQLAVLFFSPLFFQAALAFSATTTGLIYLPSTFCALAGSLTGGFMIKRVGRYYWLTTCGYMIMFLGGIPMAVGAGLQSALVVAIGLSILQFGVSISLTTGLVAIIANATPADTPVAIACSYLFRTLGTNLGIGVTTATLQQMLRVNLARELGGADRAQEIEEGVRLSLDYIRRLDPDVAVIVRECYAVATQWAFAPAAGFAVIAIASSLFIREKKLER